jgi:hypothetical protein
MAQQTLFFFGFILFSLHLFTFSFPLDPSIIIRSIKAAKNEIGEERKILKTFPYPPRTPEKNSVVLMGLP